jgi:uncharacterized damage-inducible protein DinB
MPDLRYPIGQFEPGPALDADTRDELLTRLADAPGQLRAAVAGLAESQLDTPYRLGGWTIRQVVHHLADSHMNWFIRTRLALTENEPVVKPWDEVAWAELHEARTALIEPSLDLVDGLHRRWVELFQSLTEEQWKRGMVHPERGVFVLDTSLAMWAWHIRHHTAHITELRGRMGWG